MRIVFMGTPSAAVASLKKLIENRHEIVAVYTQPDRPAGRGKKLVASPVKEFALEKGLTVQQPLKIKTAEAIAAFSLFNADVCVVVAYGRILPIEYLNAFPKGAINLHFSLLPKYRGAAPVNWAIVNGEAVSGVTTMKMDEGLDTGDIYLQREVAIGADVNSIELMARLSDVGAELLAETLETFETLTRVPQDPSKATLAPIMKREDGLIDWNLNASSIINRVRGFQPFPASFSHYNGQKITVWAAEELFEAEFTGFSSGEILQAKGDDLLVGCGNQTILSVTEIQAEGKRRMAVRDFINGLQPKVGDVFGS